MLDIQTLKIIPLESFKSDFKKLQKRYRNIKEDIKRLSVELQANPRVGIALSHHCYKSYRLANSSIPTGKSGGFRTIYYYLYTDQYLYLISIYSKIQKDTISDNELLALLRVNGLELRFDNRRYKYF